MALSQKDLEGVQLRDSNGFADTSFKKRKKGLDIESSRWRQLKSLHLSRKVI